MPGGGKDEIHGTGSLDSFGGSASISGDVVIVGARTDSDQGQSSGAAYIYRFDGATWTQEQKLLAAGGAAGHHFGGSVAISGNYAVVGAVDEQQPFVYSGAAYLYRFNGAAWAQQQKMLAADGTKGEYFGQSVAISGGVAVVGAADASESKTDSGSAYVFDETICQDPCSADLDGNGAVDVFDLLELLGQWGRCE